MYTINYKTITKGIKFHLMFFFMGVFFFFAFGGPIIIKSDGPRFIILIPTIFMLVGIVPIIKIILRVNKVKKLNKIGSLFKNVPYQLVPSGMSVNNVQILKPVVDFMMPNGQIIKLEGDARHDKIHSDADGMIDIVIDLDNPNNFFMDYNIDRIEGNRSEDYYIDLEDLYNNPDKTIKMKMHVQESDNNNYNYKYDDGYSFNKNTKRNK